MIESGIIISCQPIKNESFYDKIFIQKMVEAAIYGGAVGIRIEGIDNIRHLKELGINVPIIGLLKNKQYLYDLKHRFITRGISDAFQLCESGADIIASDFTMRENKTQKYYTKFINEIKSQYNNISIWADVSNIEEAVSAERCGVDYISSTLCGYTNNTKDVKLPDFSIIERFKNHLSVPYFSEGGYSVKEHISKALSLGCHGVVIGTAITRPHQIIKEFVSVYGKK